MKLTTRSLYGLQAVLELAMKYGEKPMKIKDIAHNTEISDKYFERFIKLLKTTGVIGSIRGPRGGYYLLKHPKDITLYDIIIPLEGQLTSISCSKHTEFKSKCSECMTQSALKMIEDDVYSLLKATSLQDLIDKKR